MVCCLAFVHGFTAQSGADSDRKYTNNDKNDYSVNTEKMIHGENSGDTNKTSN